MYTPAKTKLIARTDDYEERSITVAEDTTRDICLLYIRGPIEEVENYNKELIELDRLSSKYDRIEIVINTPGGALTTTIDLINIIRKFKYVTTFGVGEICSAGFIIWALGDVRVVAPYSLYMAHRESYGTYGKTLEHKRMALINEQINGRLYDEIVIPLLTPEEISVIALSECWIDGQSLVDRGIAITEETYNNPKTVARVDVYSIDGQMFVWNEESKVFFEVDTISITNRYVEDLNQFALGLSEMCGEQDSLDDSIC
jgi:ATP-dependent protease ClpP protease subunit